MLIALGVTKTIIGQSNDCLKQYSWYDTLTKNGNFIKYHKMNDFVTLEYGNNSFHKILDIQFPCQTADSWIPHLEWDNNDFLALKYGCGSPCSGVWMLPLDTANQVRNIMYVMAYDSKTNLIAYLDNATYLFLIVENLKTCQRKKIEFPFKTDHEEFIGYWIDEVSINGNKLYYKYSDPNVDYDKRKPKEVIIDLNPQ